MKKESSQVEAYDPLSKDMDNDGVIDRYDMDFRDSNISYKSPDVRNKRIKNKRGLETTPQRDEKLRMNYDPDEERTRDKKKKTKKEKIKKASKDEKSMSIDGIDRDKIKDDLVVDLKTNKNKKLKSNQQKFKDKKKKGFNPKKKDSKEIPSGLKKKAIDGKLDKSIILLSSMATNYMESGKEDNVAIDASTKVSSGIGKLSGKLRNHKLNKAFKIEKKRKKFENKVKKKERKTLYKSRIEAFKKTEEYEKSSRIHRFFKKKRIKRQLSKKHRESIFKRVKKSTIGSLKKVASLIEKKNKSMALIVLTCLGLFFMLFQTGSNMGSMITGVSGNVLATTYLSDESVLSDVVNEFSSYEYALQDEMESIETNYPGYDEYHVTGDTVGHENHELLSFLTARYGEIKSVDEIKKELKTLFNKMYKKEYTTRNIIKYDEEGNSYIYRIITLNIQKRNIDEIAREEFRGHETNLAHYLTLLESKGNMEAVFGSGNGDLSEIINNPNFGNPGIAFDDETVKQLFQEADKHIGKRYDFGANGPRNFDCSSFVCWSFTHSGVKNMPRTTAWGIYKDYCNPISPSEAKAGDIIFFQGTYNSGSPISHVGIYAGNGIMVHAGDPIKYVSINTPYWREHFYGFGRVK
ncbi:MAG: C40 family peptidase [Tissierellia bacterium]|nr:C40 family peptidase [Tissierellia bacterium]